MNSVIDDLNIFFNPNSVTIIGASTTPGKVGYEIVRNLIECNFKGDILPVNPKGGRILNLEVFKSIDSLPLIPDVAIVVTPADIVPKVVEECGLNGIKHVVVISSGFSEIGNRVLEEELVKTARRYGVRIIGPNSAGIINTENNFHACMEFRVPSGRVSLISQSGAVGGILFALAREGLLGFSKFVSCGNSCDITEVDVLQYLLVDNKTNSIALYVESIRNGMQFIDTCKKFRGVKPIVAFKAGKSSSGNRAALSHTGALSSPYHIYSSVFKQLGILETLSLSGLLFSAKFSSFNFKVKGSKVAIVTNSGGPGVITTDLCESFGLLLPEPSEILKNKLRSFLSPLCSLKNPIDITAMGGYDWYYNTLKEVALSNEYDLSIVVCVPPSFMNPMDAAKAIYDFFTAGFNMPIVPCFMYGDIVRECIKYLEDKGIPCTFTIEDAVYAAYSITYFGGGLRESIFR
ncbi:MAG: CoA-binding protein [Candidatus Methanomethylicia archaeon]|nr:CoA-binding protein [Candidatus Methanomethylicia archaeon]MCX8168934.1 CoA-binding protein [Candidatus Methanomethylicia archaeon]MDW7988666.1 CoA-binding protein [Nitrososphaerota archaeon]